MSSKEYVDNLQREFSKHADPLKASWEKKYMLNQFEFLGMTTPTRREITKKLIQRIGLPGNSQTESVVKMLWKMEQREFQYAAMEIAERKCGEGYEIPVQLIEYLIVHKSWWDTVDFVAPKLAGPLFIKAPVERKKTARKWVTSGNTWLVRSALLMQLKYKKETDFELMCSVIGECAVDNEFFVRKAIGWTLREYSKTNPKAVMGFVAKQEMSALSKKEALKRITAKNKS